RIFGVGGRPLHDDLRDLAGIVPGHETADWRIVRMLAHVCPVPQSSLAPTALISALQCLESSSISFSNCAGDRSTRSKLLMAKKSRVSGRSSAVATSSWIFATRSGGMLPGPNSANQAVVAKPGTPASATVGRSGRAAARLADATARIRTRPALA